MERLHLLEIFSLQATENSRQYLLIRTGISQKTAVRFPWKPERKNRSSCNSFPPIFLLSRSCSGKLSIFFEVLTQFLIATGPECEHNLLNSSSCQLQLPCCYFYSQKRKPPIATNLLFSAILHHVINFLMHLTLRTSCAKNINHKKSGRRVLDWSSSGGWPLADIVCRISRRGESFFFLYS